MLNRPPAAVHVASIDQRQVAEEWLATELGKPSSTSFDVEATDERDEVEARLLAHKPGSARSLLESNLSWSRCRLSEAALRRVYTDWGDPAERETVETVASRIRAGQSTPHVCDVDRILDLVDDDPADLGTLVIVHDGPPWKPGTPVLLDGNHRAVAGVLNVQEGATYQPHDAYVGYSGPYKLSQFRRTLHASLDIL